MNKTIKFKRMNASKEADSTIDYLVKDLIRQTSIEKLVDYLQGYTKEEVVKMLTHHINTNLNKMIEEVTK